MNVSCITYTNVRISIFQGENIFEKLEKFLSAKKSGILILCDYEIFFPTENILKAERMTLWKFGIKCEMVKGDILCYPLLKFQPESVQKVDRFSVSGLAKNCDCSNRGSFLPPSPIFLTNQ